MFDMSPGFGMMFGVFPVIFFLVFAAVITVFLVVIVKSVATGVKNNASAVLTVSARVVAKRTHTSGGVGDAPASTRYLSFARNMQPGGNV